jgi:CBS domain containing-hemolysin-like protein
MKIQVRDTIITDEYSVMVKTNDVKKIADKVAKSPNGVVVVKGKDSKILGVVTFREIINQTLDNKDLKKLKFDDLLQKKIMIIKDTDNVDRVIKRIKRRKPVATVVVNEKEQLVGYFSESDKSYAEACQKLVSSMLK